MDGRTTGFACCRRSASTRDDRLDDAGETSGIALRHARRTPARPRDPRRYRGHGSARFRRTRHRRGGNLQAALETLLAAGRRAAMLSVRAGSAAVRRPLFYWHIRGKNLTAASTRQRSSRPTVARPDAGAGGCADHGGARLVDPRRVRAGGRGVGRGVPDRVGARRRPRALLSAFCRAIGLLGSDVDAGLRGRREHRTQPRRRLPWAEALLGLRRDPARPSRATPTRREPLLPRARDPEAARRRGRSWPLARRPRAAGRRAGDLRAALDLYRQSLASFETCGDGWRKRGSSTRWRGRTSGTETTLARRHFLDAVQAYTDVGSVRGVGLSLIGLAATEASRTSGRRGRCRSLRPPRATRRQEGIVNVYSDETPDASLSTRHERSSQPTRSPAPRRSAAGSRSRKRSTSRGL